MGLIAELSLASDTLPFSSLLADGEVARLRFSSILPTGQSTLPYCRLWSNDVERAVGALQGDVAVESSTLLSASDGTGLLRVEWASDAFEWLRDGVDASHTILLGATVTPNEWSVRIFAPTGEALSTFQRYCREAGISTTLTKVRAQASESGEVTPSQQEALLHAVERGYFDRPRAVTLAELGDEIGISRQAFAGRLRRGIRNLVRETLKRPETEHS